MFSFVHGLLIGFGIMGGKAFCDIRQAVKTVEERYGITVTITKPKLFPTGAVCDVTARCSELPDRNIRIFQFDKKTPVQCDYIYQKYGDEAYSRICSTVRTVFPNALTVVEDSGYNHFISGRYDMNTTIDDYLLDNQLRVKIALQADYDEEKLLEEYHRMAEKMSEDGINSYSLGLYCMKNQAAVDAIRTYEHIPDHQTFEGIPADGVRISVTNLYGRLRDYLKDPQSAGLVIHHGS